MIKFGYWARRTWHFAGAIFPLTILFFPQERNLLLTVIGVFFLAVLSFEITRFTYPAFNEHFMQFFQGALKEGERNRPTASFYYILSSWACIYFFPPKIAAAALLNLTFGDQAANWVGVNWGRTKLGSKNKSLEGTLSCLVVCSVLNFMLLPPLVALGGALAATLVEALFPWQDDNLTVPIGAAVVMQIISVMM